jgi:hypothetical protein
VFDGVLKRGVLAGYDDPTRYLFCSRTASIQMLGEQVVHFSCVQDDSLGGDAEATDVRASLILNLLLQAVDYPAPNLTHLLLGFNVVEGPQGKSPAATSLPTTNGAVPCLRCNADNHIIMNIPISFYLRIH